MQTITWVPNSNAEYDALFDSLREKQSLNTEHRYYKNYEKEYFTDTILHSIYFGDNGDPEVCSSICKRSCWPDKAYRILNRTWKPMFRQKILREVLPPIYYTTKSQIEWLLTNTDCELYFISRQTNHWTSWITKSFKEKYNIEFFIGEHKYLTCHHENDDTCWQQIIYNGNKKLLDDWKHK